MAYSFKQSNQAVVLIKNMLFQAVAQTVALATVLADTDLQALIAVPAELEDLIDKRLNKEFRMTGGARAEAILTIAGTTNGNSQVGVEIGGVPYRAYPDNGDSPASVASALSAEINRWDILDASVAGAVVTVTFKENSAGNNDSVITDITTDLVMTITTTQEFAGGADASDLQLVSTSKSFSGTSSGAA